MKRDLILHIGVPKTGTTSIQNVLASRRDELLARGVFYPRSPGPTGHHLLPASIAGPDLDTRRFFPTLWGGLTPAARLEAFRREFDEELRNLPEEAGVVVISSEHCGASLRSEAAIESLAGLLRPHFERVRIVAYLRRQDLLVASLYSERLRVGEIGEPELPAGDLKHVWLFDYETMLGTWAAVFGDEAITTRIYERQSLHNDDVVDDFLQTCGIDIEIPEDDPLRERNSSMSVAAQELMTVIGRRFQGTRKGEGADTRLWRRTAEVCSKALPGDGWRPTRSEAIAFMAQFADGNEAVRRRFLPQREVLFADSFDELPDSRTKLSRETLVVSAIDVLLHEIEFSGRQQGADSLRLARAFRKLGEGAKAKKALLNAVWCDPKLAAARVDLADAMLGDGDFAGAREHARKAQELEPDSEPLRRLLNRLGQRERQGDEGATRARKAPPNPLSRSKEP